MRYYTTNHIDVIEAFRQAAAERSIDVPTTPIIGKLTRCGVIGGRRGEKDGAYLIYLDGIPSGGFQSFKDGTGWEKWCYKAAGNIRLSPAEIARRREAFRQAQIRRDIEAQATAARREIGWAIFNYHCAITGAEKRLIRNSEDNVAWYWLGVAYHRLPRLEYIHNLLLAKGLNMTKRRAA